MNLTGGRQQSTQAPHLQAVGERAAREAAGAQAAGQAVLLVLVEQAAVGRSGGVQGHGRVAAVDLLQLLRLPDDLPAVLHLPHPTTRASGECRAQGPADIGPQQGCAHDASAALQQSLAQEARMPLLHRRQESERPHCCECRHLGVACAQRTPSAAWAAAVRGGLPRCRWTRGSWQPQRSRRSWRTPGAPHCWAKRRGCLRPPQARRPAAPHCPACTGTAASCCAH